MPGNCWWCGKEVEDSWEHWEESDICEFGFMYGWWPAPLPQGGLFVGMPPSACDGYAMVLRSFS